jgi:hypothetical protein
MRKKIFFFASSLDARCWLSKSSDPFPCSKQYYMLCVSPLSFHIEILLDQHGRSALDTSRTLFLLASTQGVSCRLVMNHLIYVYVLCGVAKWTTVRSVYLCYWKWQIMWKPELPGSYASVPNLSFVALVRPVLGICTVKNLFLVNAYTVMYAQIAEWV